MMYSCFSQTKGERTMKRIIAIALAATLIGCADMPKRECSATYESGGMVYEVAIFGVKRINDHTFVRPGYPFSYHWVSAENFKNSDCSI